MGMAVFLQGAAEAGKEKTRMQPLGQCLTHSKHSVVLVTDIMMSIGTLHTFDAIIDHEEMSINQVPEVKFIV